MFYAIIHFYYRVSLSFWQDTVVSQLRHKFNTSLLVWNGRWVEFPPLQSKALMRVRAPCVCAPGVCAACVCALLVCVLLVCVCSASVWALCHWGGFPPGIRERSGVRQAKNSLLNGQVTRLADLSPYNILIHRAGLSFLLASSSAQV